MEIILPSCCLNMSILSFLLTRSKCRILARPNRKVMPLNRSNAYLSSLTKMGISSQNHDVIKISRWDSILLASGQQYVHYDSNLRKEDGDTNNLEVEIVSRENVKPATPTPYHLRTYEVSIFDQLMSANAYIPFVYFYPNDKFIQVIQRRKQILKHALSETLVRFYPMAGRFLGDRRIDCNDSGVYYVEAKVSDYTLLDFLKHPRSKLIHSLLPNLDNNSSVTQVQVTEFSCGGLAIGLLTSHKIIDGYSYGTFMKAWAGAACGGLEPVIYPNFSSPLIFPSNPSLPDYATNTDIFPKLLPKPTVTKRFVFSASTLSTLKKSCASAPSRALAVTGLISKYVMDAYKYECSTSVVSIAVNLRERSSPPMPPYLIGNIFARTQCKFDGADLGLNDIVQRLKAEIDKMDAMFIGKLKGQEGSLIVFQDFIELVNIYFDKNIEQLNVSSILNFDLYGVDFGWGKPIWIWFGSIPSVSNILFLMDTRSGKGVEAWLSLPEHTMDILEHNQDFLEFVSVEPSPLDQ